MATDMEASMFSMISMLNIHVHACVHACACICMCVCMGYSHIPSQPPPTPKYSSATPQGGGPPESVKIQ